MQTGNMILLVYNLYLKEFSKALMYLIPIFAFMFGAFLAQVIEVLVGTQKKIKWYQVVVLLESIVIIPSIFIPIGDYNFLANMFISLSCGMQLHSFRKTKGQVVATTMCTGNLKSVGDNLAMLLIKKDKSYLKNMLMFISFILTFMFGCLISYITSNKITNYSLVIPFIVLFVTLILLIVIKEKEDLNNIEC